MIFADKLSEKIFDLRTKYANTNNYRYIADLSLLSYESATGQSFLNVIKNFSNKKVVLFGIGAIGQEVYNFFNFLNLKIDFHYTNGANKSSFFHNIPFIDVNSLGDTIDEYAFIIGTSIPSYIKEIQLQLYKIGADKKSIIFTNFDMQRQYFSLPQIKTSKEEVFIDAGTFNGDDCIDFIKTYTNYKKIYAFEPDIKNYENCINKLRDYANIEVINSGLWSENTRLSFSFESTGSSHISGNNTNTINVVSLDTALPDEIITWIKMDIEGAEIDAINGARLIIEKHKPKMSVCVYHKPLDIIQIPEILHNLNKDYTFYLRHYSLGILETVLYAL